MHPIAFTLVMHPEDDPTVSVVIPVYNDWHSLVQTVACICGQKYPADTIEIIVIDNGSQQPRPELMPPDSRIRLLSTERVGSFAARNDGWRHARGEIIAFTDADCLPQDDWLAQGVAALQQKPQAAFAAGKVQMFYSRKQPTLIELYDSLISLRAERFLVEQHFGLTANLFVRRETLVELGPFREAYLSAGDQDWGNRAYQAGRPGIFCASAVVHHPARTTLRAVVLRSLRVTADRTQCRQSFPHLYASTAQRFWQHFIKRPGQLWQDMAQPEWRCSGMRRSAVLALYYTIKIIQMFERMRISCGGQARR